MLKSAGLVLLFAGLAAATVAMCPAACGVCPPEGVEGACCHGGKKCEERNWNPKTCVAAGWVWCTSAGPTPPPPPPPTPPPTPPGPPTPPVPPLASHVRWTGVNMAGFAYGDLARAGAVWCTDAQCSSGGWSD